MFQVIGPNEALVEYEWSTPVVNFIVLNGKKQAYGTKPHYSDKMYWVSGVSTGSWVDGREVKLNGLFHISGTETYETTLASKTVPVLTPIQVEDESQFARQHEAREWHLKDGSIIRGVYAGYERGEASIAVGSELKAIKMAELSDDDRKFVREQIQAAR